MEPGRRPEWRPLKRHESHEAEEMVERAAGLAKDSHARTRHAAVLVKDGSMVAWGTNGVPFPGEDHCYCKYAEFGVHDNCRTHAEQRAINLAREGDGWKMLQGSNSSTSGSEPTIPSGCRTRTSALAAAAWRCRLGSWNGSSRFPTGWSGAPRRTTTASPSSAGKNHAQLVPARTNPPGRCRSVNPARSGSQLAGGSFGSGQKSVIRVIRSSAPTSRSTARAGCPPRPRSGSWKPRPVPRR